MGGRAWESPRITRDFQISLAPPGAGPEYHHSGLQNGFAPPHTLTVTRYALHLAPTPVSQAQLLGLWLGRTVRTLTLDYNERARVLTLKS